MKKTVVLVSVVGGIFAVVAGVGKMVYTYAADKKESQTRWQFVDEKVESNEKDIQEIDHRAQRIERAITGIETLQQQQSSYNKMLLKIYEDK